MPGIAAPTKTPRGSAQGSLPGEVPRAFRGGAHGRLAGEASAGNSRTNFSGGSHGRLQGGSHGKQGVQGSRDPKGNPRAPGGDVNVISPLALGLPWPHHPGPLDYPWAHPLVHSKRISNRVRVADRPPMPPDPHEPPPHRKNTRLRSRTASTRFAIEAPRPRSHGLWHTAGGLRNPGEPRGPRGNILY